jgi:hypothetical protein
VPYGKLHDIARVDFGDPARDMGLRYLEYAVTAKESSLMAVFGKDYPIIRDPVAVHLSGWGNVAEWSGTSASRTSGSTSTGSEPCSNRQCSTCSRDPAEFRFPFETTT